MNKKRILKGVLVLIVLAVLSLGFTGCGTTIITTTTPAIGTVYVYTNSWDDYTIYMDSVWQGYSYYTSSYFVIYNVPVGYHTFSADGWWYDGSQPQYIYSGTNYVTITTW